MKNYVNGFKDDSDIFNNIDFNRDEIKGTDETFFNEENNKNNSEYSLDLEKSENSLSSDKLDLCDKSMEEEMNKVTLNNNENNNIKLAKPRISKNDLNTIPLPIFDCIYCANEKVVFNHLISEELSLQYLYNADKKDIYLINFLIENNLLSIENKKNIDIKKLISNKNININKLKSLINLILNNTEYFSKYYNINESQNYLKQKRKRNINNNTNINIIKNKNKKIDKFDFDREKYGQEKNKLFDDDSSDNNINENYEKINKITQKIIENESIKNENNKLDKSIEEKICDSFNRLLDDDSSIDLSRKIKWNDIDFEKKPYNIWENNSIDDDIDLEKDF